jgi:hypothetical protein
MAHRKVTPDPGSSEKNGLRPSEISQNDGGSKLTCTALPPLIVRFMHGCAGLAGEGRPGPVR